MKIKIFFAALLILLECVLFIYPAFIISSVMFDPELRTTGQSRLVPMWFETAVPKYNQWAENFLETKYATTLRNSNVSATEWPMFGSVFFLITAEELQSQGKIDITQKNIRMAVNNAARIIASPDTATWVRKKWKKSYYKTGKSYLEKENVFYRMLLIMGLSSYEKITSDTKYHALVSRQAKSLADELSHAKFHLADDYPDQCYPNDVLWAIAAIKKADISGVEITKIKSLSKQLFNVLSHASSNSIPLPAFQMDAKTARVIQNARGSGTSGILQFAPMLDINISKQWYQTYVEYFWKESSFIVGFKEFSENRNTFTDADTGPIITDIGSVASLFGIGASKGVGQLNHAVPLSIEAVACSWPTPFGFLLPSIMSKVSVDSWALGDIALLFSMTRPIYADSIIAFNGSIPLSVWGILFIFLISGAGLIFLEIRYIRNIMKKHKKKEQ